MSRLRLATYNVEWFNALFDDQGRVLDDPSPSQRHGINRADQLAAIAIVMIAMLAYVRNAGGQKGGAHG